MKKAEDVFTCAYLMQICREALNFGRKARQVYAKNSIFPCQPNC